MSPTGSRRRRHRGVISASLASIALLAMGGCGAMRGGDPQFVVGPQDLQPGRPEGVTLTVPGRFSYDQVWNAALAAMSQGKTVVESHKPTGVIKSRIGAAPSGPMVGIFITPTTPRAAEYRVETSSVKPLGFNAISGRGWEPAVVEDFKAALGQR